jgi:phage gp46-like protein
MSGDVALFFNSNPEGISIDALIESNDLATDDGLRTGVLISLFTDRRVTADELPFGEQSLRGWWGDLFPDQDGDQIGSRLWLLAREKRSVETTNRAVEYSEEALQWMIDDGLAESVTVDAAYDGNGFMILTVLIQKPVGTELKYRFKLKWNAEGDRS